MRCRACYSRADVWHLRNGRGRSGAAASGVLELMGDALRHRGPDGHAEFMAPRRGSAPSGCASSTCMSAPISRSQSPDALVWLECNGEIYNAAEIRARYPDYPYRSNSDVETILPLYLERGVAGDSSSSTACSDWPSGIARIQTLTLARDRAGEKPLFYARLAARCFSRRSCNACCVIPISAASSTRSPSTSTSARLRPRAAHTVPAVRRVAGGDVHALPSRRCRETVRYWDPTAFRIHRSIRARSHRRDATSRRARRDKQVMVGCSGGRLHQRRTRFLDPGDARVEGHRRRQGAHVFGAVRRAVVRRESRTRRCWRRGFARATCRCGRTRKRCCEALQTVDERWPSRSPIPPSCRRSSLRARRAST